jgi:hypothetical protein
MVSARLISVKMLDGAASWRRSVAAVHAPSPWEARNENAGQSGRRLFQIGNID